MRPYSLFHLVSPWPNYPVYVVSILVCWLACETAPILVQSFSPIADFEEQESTMICWDPQHRDLLVPLIARISQTDQVNLFFNENHHQPQRIVSYLAGAQANLKQITMSPFRLEKDNIWIRDYGPSFVRDEAGNIQIIGLEYPHEEFYDYRKFSEQYSLRMKIPFLKTILKGTGGGREINGKGTMILIEGYEKEINPGMSKEEIEEEYTTRFNQRHFIWLKRGIPQDDFPGYGPIVENIYGTGANWHVDEFCRFVNANTILLAQVDSGDLVRDPFYQIIHDRLEENFQILSQATDQDGNPLHIVRIPQAPVIFAAGKQDTSYVFYTPVTSYLNFIITNTQIIAPSYHTSADPEYVRLKDESAVNVLKEVFPTREISTIDATSLNYKGGGLHCITLGKPKIPQKWQRKRTKNKS